MNVRFHDADDVGANVGNQTSLDGVVVIAKGRRPVKEIAVVVLHDHVAAGSNTTGKQKGWLMSKQFDKHEDAESQQGRGDDNKTVGAEHQNNPFPQFFSGRTWPAAPPQRLR